MIHPLHMTDGESCMTLFHCFGGNEMVWLTQTQEILGGSIHRISIVTQTTISNWIHRAGILQGYRNRFRGFIIMVNIRILI